MKLRHLEEILDFAELDVQEDVIREYQPPHRPSAEGKCFAFRVNKPFEEAAPKLAEFYVALGAVAQGYAENMYTTDDVDSEGWSRWHLDAYPGSGRGGPYTVFYFPDGKVED